MIFFRSNSLFRDLNCGLFLAADKPDKTGRGGVYLFRAMPVMECNL